MNAINLPQYVTELLASRPTTGDGIHNWLFHAARALHPYRNEWEIADLLASAVTNCGRRVPQREVWDAVRNSKGARMPIIGRRAAFKETHENKGWPSKNVEAIEALYADGPGLADLWEMSPVRLEDNKPHAEEIIDQLFPDNPLLCVGKYSWEFETRPREEWRGHMAAHQLIVPSPMAGKWGKTGVGRPSQHTKDNTGEEHDGLI